MDMDDDFFVGPESDEPMRFRSNDEMMRYVFENVIKPRLEAMAEEGGEFAGLNPEDVSIEPYVIATEAGDEASMAEQRAECERLSNVISEGLSKGLSMDYILEELTDLPISARTTEEMDGMRVSMVRIEPRTGDSADVRPMPADELQRLFAQDSNGSDETNEDD